MKDKNSIVVIIMIIVFSAYLLYEKGYILANFERMSVKEAYDLSQKQPQEVIVVDVRTPEEHAKDGKIKGSILMPLSTLGNNINQLQAYKDKKILLYCRSGTRSITASRIVAAAGYKAYNVDGGMNAWKGAALPIQ
ncbi:MAG: rhodanese-like domain-containing protein [Campylobacterota bacterium]|nr:rhodanese-like domain-containing protein [Campylobacterota bacterium]